MKSTYLPAAGVSTELVEFDSGGRRVQGAVFAPSQAGAHSDTAVILVHGVEMFWYVGPTMFLATCLAGEGYTTLGYNGAHSGQTFRWSKFETAVEEVQAAIDFMKSRNFRRVILIGHSLGTPIIEHYAGDKPDPALMAIAVYGPHISIPEVTRNSLLGPDLYNQFRDECRSLVQEGRGNEIRLLPYRKSATIITSAETFLSYRDVDGSKASVRPVLKNIKVPMLIVYDPADNIHGMGVITMRETIVRDITAAAVSAKSIDTVVVPSIAGRTPVEAHSFIGNETFVVNRTKSWLDQITAQQQ